MVLLVRSRRSCDCRWAHLTEGQATSAARPMTRPTRSGGCCSPCQRRPKI